MTMVMPANNTKGILRWLAKRYPGRIGHLYSPDSKGGPWKEFPYALDNGCFTKWDPPAFRAHLDWAKGKAQQPLWVVAPDVISDWNQTKQRWRAWAPWISDTYGFKLALAVQDGSTPDEVLDITPQPDVIFVGGSTTFKWESVYQWCTTFPRVHIGRVNSPEKLWELLEMGAESCDGTGWMRGRRRQFLGLIQFLRRNQPQHFKTMFNEQD